MKLVSQDEDERLSGLAEALSRLGYVTRFDFYVNTICLYERSGKLVNRLRFDEATAFINKKHVALEQAYYWGQLEQQDRY